MSNKDQQWFPICKYFINMADNLFGILEIYILYIRKKELSCLYISQTI